MYKKVYIYCVGGYKSGGPQTLHQLCSQINNLSIATEAFIYYENKQKEITKGFEKFNVRICSKIDDCEKNLLIVPEVCTHSLNKYKKINKSILWLSWDNYVNTTVKEYMHSLLFRHKYMRCFKLTIYIYYNFVRGMRNKETFIGNNKIKHFYNCEYVKNKIISIGVSESNCTYLCGPLSDIFFSNIEYHFEQKKNIVVYNPKKGKHITDKIINYCKKQVIPIDFIPIENMSEEEVFDTLYYSKVYIDFGEFPGPERIPREAAMLYCNILTSNLGAAENDEDILIPKKYKFDVKKLELMQIYNQIIDFFDHYEKYVHDFDAYRAKIEQQKYLFDKNLNDFITKDESDTNCNEL